MRIGRLEIPDVQFPSNIEEELRRCTLATGDGPETLIRCDPRPGFFAGIEPGLVRLYCALRIFSGDPENGFPALDVMFRFLELGDTESALKLLDSLSGIDLPGLDKQVCFENPDFHAAWILADLGRRSEAIARYQESLKRVQFPPGAVWGHIATVHQEGGEFEEAAEACRQGIAEFEKENRGDHLEQIRILQLFHENASRRQPTEVERVEYGLFRGKEVWIEMDIRDQAAKFYDFNPAAPDDVSFYRERLPSPQARVLELGCGTGRVLVPLAASCARIRGIDRSEAMLSICRRKLAAAGIPAEKALVETGDITAFSLGSKFDLIIAPYRVLQNLETDSEVNDLLQCVREHLAPDGSCILNAFMPNRDPEGLRREWVSEAEEFCWEVPVEGGRVTHHVRRQRMDRGHLVLYPDLIWRRYEGDALGEEVSLTIPMRCWYPEDLERLISGWDFRITGRWGGYGGEVYGKGPELVVQFTEGGAWRRRMKK